MPDTPIISGQNGKGSIAWDPETPFLNEPTTVGTMKSAPGARHSLPRSVIESPFSAEYIGQDAQPGPHAETFATLMAEFQDEAFAEALEDLVDDAAASLESEFNAESVDTVRDRSMMERRLGAYLAPLAETTERMLDRMTAELGEKDLGGLSEPELEALLDGFAPPDANLAPPFEGFLKGVFNKAKRAVKSAVNVAKKVASAVALPHLLILNRLKGLVRPLLDRVLRFAIDKLPVSLRPLATQLAQRFLGGKRTLEAEQTEDSEANSDSLMEASAADPRALEEEFDARLAGYLLAPDQQEDLEGEANALHASDLTITPMQMLEQARRDFTDGVVRLQEGEDPAPLVEQFVPAILAALRIGIKIVGRPRVVKFLADLVAKLISRYVGQQQAPALSRALVDVGLRTVSLEATGEEPAAHTLAATVEDTVNRLVQSAPAAAWQSEALLEAYVQEAFQEAASAHFPDPLIREEFHEAAEVSSAWAPLPAKTARKRYKKYGRTIEISITPQIAKAVKTFGGITLGDFLRDRLGVDGARPIRARVHLYEAIPGTRLSLIALHERDVAGLGTSERRAWSLFHPLTPETAGLLLNEPGLGRPVTAQFLARRRVTAVGQRFFYLEIPGARARLVTKLSGRPSRPARSTQARVAFDFIKRELRIVLYYSEAGAQDIVKQLRQKLPPPVLLKTLRARYDQQLRQILSSASTRAVRVIHEAAPTDELQGSLLSSVLRVAGRPLSDVLITWTLEALKRELESRYDRFVAEFERAAQADEDGVSIRIVLEVPVLFERLRHVLSQGNILSAPAAVSALARQTLSSHHVTLHAGFAQN